MASINIKGLVAFIESNTTGTGEKFIRSALNNGFEVLFLTNNPKKYSFIKKLLIHPILIDTDEPEKLYDYLKNIVNLKAVTSTSENFIYNASVVAQKLSLPCANPTSIKNCRNKFALIETLFNANLPFIKSKLINTVAQTADVLEQFKFPVVIKPNFGTGSVGVKLCYSMDEANNHIEKLINKCHDKNCEILIQEYIHGEEFSAEIIALNNEYHLLGITKKYLGAEPYFVEIGHEFPALIEPSLKNEIFNVLSKALQAVEFTFGPVHIEFRLYEKKVYVIEINPRLAGGMIPMLIEHSQGIQLIDNLIKLYANQPVDFIPKTSLVTKIEFFLPKYEGCLISVYGLDEIKKQNNIVDVQMYKSEGDNIYINGDFSDRLGFIIAQGQDLNECRNSIVNARNKLSLDICPTSKRNDAANQYARDRLSAPLDPKIKLILSEKLFQQCTDFQLLSLINKAHLLMLEKCKIIPVSEASLMANAITELEQNNFAMITQLNKMDVGYYLIYERALINKLGVGIAGNIHIGRSRNDINATIQRLKSRQIFINLFTALWDLRSELLLAAANSFAVTMPIYSQFQPAMPATYAYYLLAIEHSLALSQSNLKKNIDILDTSPLGASAGAGTIFPVDPIITSKLLGFDRVEFNALSAVASRDIELMLLSCGAVIGVNLSRIAQDYQLWSTNEFSFIEIPDQLCGISSVMPQKKNPYLLEKIKGKAINISGVLTAALAIMHKTPFANSVEVGTEALINYTASMDELICAIKLLELIIAEAKPIQKNMRQSNIQGLTVATAVAELLTKNNSELSYRQAHAIVGNTIANALEKDQEPLAEILKLTDDISTDPDKWHLLFEYGNGPGKLSTENMLLQAIHRLNTDGGFLRSKIDQWENANKSLAREINQLINL